jgi:hypothetical protein
MNKEFIPYEQALELNELGFNEECLAVVNVNSYELKIINGSYNEELYLPIPLYQQAFRWFREKYKCESSVISLHLPFESYREYQFVITHPTSEVVEANFNTYEEAELACLKKLIEIVKNK